jgi:hypothetical protein
LVLIFIYPKFDQKKFYLASKLGSRSGEMRQETVDKFINIESDPNPIKAQ